jgi:limonene-1,2-epoxide hydrolase
MQENHVVGKGIVTWIVTGVFAVAGERGGVLCLFLPVETLERFTP